MEDLTHCGIEITSQFDGFGLLNATHIHQLPADTSTYNFAHLTIQEFLCSCYIFLLPEQEQQYLLNKYFDDYPTIFLFLCGLSASDLNDGLHQLVYSRLISSDDVIPTVRCMYETNHNMVFESSLKPFTLNMAYNSLVPYDCMCVCHVLSSCPVSQLKMEKCMIEDKGAEALVRYCHSKLAASNHQILELVDISENNLSAIGMTHVVKMMSKSKISLSVIANIGY